VAAHSGAGYLSLMQGRLRDAMVSFQEGAAHGSADANEGLRILSRRRGGGGGGEGGGGGGGGDTAYRGGVGGPMYKSPRRITSFLVGWCKLTPMLRHVLIPLEQRLSEQCLRLKHD
jgi:hypothetical protein